MRFYLLSLFSLVVLCSPSAEGQNTLTLTKVAGGLSGPVGLVYAKDGSDRIFVLEQSGTVRVIENGMLLPTPFLDLSSKLAKISPYYSEMGLLGMAFHPDFKRNARVYVHYSAPSTSAAYDHQTIIAEFRASFIDPNMVDFNSHRVIFSLDQPASNHNGGAICFGPDGYLYIGLGDGGGAGDRFGVQGNGQNLQSLLGKLLRINIDETPYGIPRDNPLLAAQRGRPEIYAWGFRNPWHFSFAADGRLFVADIGQNKWEEINLVEKGGNYGWRLMEGPECYKPDKNCEHGERLVRPIYAYQHTNEQVSVIGGHVYRGTQIPTLLGKYVFADWKGKVMVLAEEGGTWVLESVRFRNVLDPGYINSLGEDAAGNLYLLTQFELGPKNRTGVLYRLER